MTRYPNDPQNEPLDWPGQDGPVEENDEVENDDHEAEVEREYDTRDLSDEGLF